MTDLRSRPRTASPSRPPRPTSTSRPSAASADGSRPVVVVAVATAAVAVAGSLVVVVALILGGWFAAGAPGKLPGALGVGAQAWLLGHGAPLLVDGVRWTLLPLGLTMLLATMIHRAARWLVTAPSVRTGADLLVTGSVFAATYLGLAVLVAVVAAAPGAQAELGGVLTRLGGLVIVSTATGVISGAGRWRWLAERLPSGIRPMAGPVVGQAAVTVLLVLAIAAVLTGAGLLVHLDEAAAVMAKLDLATPDAITLTVLMAALLPNAVLCAVGYLFGSGFALGADTVVSPTSVDVGSVPALPMLAAAPSAALPNWLSTLVLAIPLLLSALAAVWVQRRHHAGHPRTAALIGGGGGLLAATVLAGLAALAHGAAGDARLADVGPSALAMWGPAVLSLGLGGVVGAVGYAMFGASRIGPAVADDPGPRNPEPTEVFEVAPAPDAAGATGDTGDTEDTVRVPLPEPQRPPAPRSAGSAD